MKVIFIGGATASGKTDLSLKLAKQHNGEIISADSRQIYINLDIGTAKVATRKDPPANTQDLYQQSIDYAGIPHYLIDIVYPGQRYTLFDFKNQAYQLIQQISERGKTPIVVGGTGLYFDALIHNYQLEPKIITENLERKTLLEDEYSTLSQSLSPEAAKKIMHAQLAEIDPLAAKKIHPSNIYSTIRALEFASLNNKKSKIKSSRKSPPPFDYQLILTDLPRKTLYERINDRIDQQMTAGLLAETQFLLEKYSQNCPALTSLGYQELTLYLQDQLTYQAAIDLFKQKTRNYAKRQLTWFRRYSAEASTPPPN